MDSNFVCFRRPESEPNLGGDITKIEALRSTLSSVAFVKICVSSWSRLALIALSSVSDGWSSIMAMQSRLPARFPIGTRYVVGDEPVMAANYGVPRYVIMPSRYATIPDDARTVTAKIPPIAYRNSVTVNSASERRGGALRRSFRSYRIGAHLSRDTQARPVAAALAQR